MKLLLVFKNASKCIIFIQKWRMHAYQQIQYFQILQSSQIIIETSYEIHKSAYMIAYKMQ